MKIPNNLYIQNSNKYLKGKLPEFLMFEKIFEINEHKRSEFTLYSTKDKSEKCFMVCRKTKLPYRGGYNEPCLAIDYLVSYEGNRGFGSKMLDFAKKLNQKISPRSYIILKSDSSLFPNKAPHQFYRKNGFSTDDEVLDKKIDYFNKKRIQGTYKDFKPKLMFFPSKEKKNFLSKVKDFLHI